MNIEKDVTHLFFEVPTSMGIVKNHFKKNKKEYRKINNNIFHHIESNIFIYLHNYCFQFQVFEPHINLIKFFDFIKNELELLSINLIEVPKLIIGHKISIENAAENFNNYLGKMLIFPFATPEVFSLNLSYRENFSQIVNIDVKSESNNYLTIHIGVIEKTILPASEITEWLKDAREKASLYYWTFTDEGYQIQLGKIVNYENNTHRNLS